MVTDDTKKRSGEPEQLEISLGEIRGMIQAEDLPGILGAERCAKCGHEPHAPGTCMSPDDGPEIWDEDSGWPCPCGEAEKAQGARRQGGPEECPRRCVDCEGEKHHWGEYFGFKDGEPDEDDQSTGPEHPAAKAGLKAWQVCKHCPAWREMLDEDDDDAGDADFDDP